MALRISLLLLFIVTVFGLYESNGPVPLLNPRTFDAKIRKSNHSSIVEFFAPWCGHCKNLAPAYTKAAEHMSGIFTFAAVDCDDQQNRGLCAEFDIKGFPTLKFMKPYMGKVDATDYHGPRTAKGLVEFAKTNMENLVLRLTDENLNAFLVGNNETAKAILITDKGATSALYKSLAIDFKGRMTLAQARDSQSKVVQEFSVKKYPTLVMLPGGTAPGIVFTGEMKRDPMYKFLSEYAPEVAPATTSQPGQAPKRHEAPTPALQKITSFSEFTPFCFDAGLCFLFLSPSTEDLKTFTAISHRLHSNKKLRLYSTDLLTPQADIFAWDQTPPAIALNAAKGWYKIYEGEIIEERIAEWIDGVTMGEGKKIPFGDNVKEALGFKKHKPTAITREQKEEEAKMTEPGVQEVFGDGHDEL